MGPRSEDPKLITRVINFELVQPICSRYVNVTDRRTNGQTDGRLTIAIPRFALRSSRGKNEKSIVMYIYVKNEGPLKGRQDAAMHGVTAQPV